MRKAKIVCTIGPSCEDRQIIRKMIQVGMDVARLNFSHGNYTWFKDIVSIIREESKKLNKSVALLQDLQGIKIRVGEVKEGSIFLNEGQLIEIYAGSSISNEKRIFISYDSLLKDVDVGEEIFLDDGILKIRVIDKLADRLIGEVIEGGVLRSRKGVNFPNSSISSKSLTKKDKKDLIFGIKLDVDYIAVSFIRTAEDIEYIKSWAKKNNIKLPPLIAKIEKREAIENIDEILDAVEGIMVARGDLGVELPTEEVPVYQKMLIEAANSKRKLVITATQMLESMKEHRRPTRAEATDVANAVLDGTDALMLSAETAVGKYPVESIKTMGSIISFTEKAFPVRVASSLITNKSFPEAIATGAVRVAQEIKAKVIVVFTHSGFTALLISKLRPSMPIVAFSPDKKVYNQLSLYWGIIPRHLPKDVNIIDDLFLRETEKELKILKLVKDGDAVVFVASSPFLGNKNVIRLHKAGDSL
ncbi:MAG: pyruvate kinase [Thermodesulfovibrio sp.]|nr:pyruvate kinase [Thermodesulfovibrio sp.]MDW7972942.1 pyruvate kinase [Thermodesulfovibrio sp.]